MVRLSKPMCRLWLARLEEAEKDEAQGTRLYAQYAQEAPFNNEFFRRASKDEARHHEQIHLMKLYVIGACED